MKTLDDKRYFTIVHSEDGFKYYQDGFYFNEDKTQFIKNESRYFISILGLEKYVNSVKCDRVVKWGRCS